MLASIMLGALLLADHPPRFGFRDYRLGMTLEQFRAVPVQDERGRKHRIACADRALQIDGISLSEKEAAAGLVRCAFQGEINGKWYTGGVLINSTTEAQILFSFHRGVLYDIEMWSNIGAAAEIKEGLVSRFGKPALEEPFHFQTRSGAVFPARRTAWLSSLDQIEILAPDRAATRVTVRYLDKEVSAKVADMTRDPARM